MSNNTTKILSGERINQSDLKKKLQRYVRNWYVFALSLIIMISLAFFYLRYATPMYTTGSKILIKDDKTGAGVVDPSEAFSDLDVFKTGKNINNEVEVFKGKALMAMVMEELDLNTTYYTEGKVKTVEIYGEDLPIKVVTSELGSAAFGETIDLTLINNRQFELTDKDGTLRTEFGKLQKRSYGTFTVIASGKEIQDGKHIQVKFHDLYTLGASYSSRVAITPLDKGSSVLNITLVDAVPQKGADIVNKLIEVYNREAVADKNKIAENTVNFIDERLSGLVNDLTAVEMDVEQYKKRHNIADVGVEAQNYVQEASGYRREEANYETQISVLESLQSYLQNSGSDELVPGSMGIQDPTLIGLTSKFNELQLERQRLLRTQKEANPLVKGIDEQLKNLRGNIQENLSNIKKSLVISRNNLSANTGRYRARVSNVPTIERNLLEIQRQQGIKEALYSYLLQKREESAISLASSVSDTRIIDTARPGKSPVSPNSILVYLTSFLLGLIIPIGLLSMKDSFNEKVQTAVDVERITDTPILGEITHSRSKGNLVVKNGSRSEISEVFRLIRSNLKYTFPKQEKQIILVTSSMSGEGKTFISLNLGSSLAITGKKVLVMEFDLRLPKLLNSLGLSQENEGIVEYINDPKRRATDLVIPIEEVPGLSIMAAGHLPTNPSEILMNDRMGTLMEELKQEFDYILIDSSPIGQVADAFSFSEFAQMVIYVVRYNYTYKQQINIANDIAINDKFTNITILMNDAKIHNGYGYGYGYAKGYGYGK